jgi:serine/threonine protein kinase
MSEKLLRLTLKHILLALDFLHAEAGIIHTGMVLETLSTCNPHNHPGQYLTFTVDIQEKNILLGIEDNTLLSGFEEDERNDPSPRKIDSNNIIYQTRKLRNSEQYGRPVLCDFGEARLGSSTFHEDIQPYIYRAPEVLLRMTWSQKVDIWNLGVLVC